MIHVSGKQMYKAMLLSGLGAEMNAFIDTVISSLPASDTKLKEIVEAEEDDKVCKRVKQLGLVASTSNLSTRNIFVTTNNACLWG